ncbi:Trypsin domain containing protein, partial [Asbolus verrucosus]
PDEGNGIISDGRGLIEIRKLKQCNGVFEVCCNTTIPKATEAPPKQPRGCGRQNNETFPWSASLLYKQYPNFVPSYKCRVSLIHPKVALTAVHCLDEDGFYLVRISGTIRATAQIIIHPHFKPSSLQNDIAILILNKPFKFSEKIGTVCIPPPEAVLNGSDCTAATWLQEKRESLKIIQLPIVPKDDCLEMLRKTRLGSFLALHYSFLCAGGDADQDTCGADGGSPLICPVPGVPGRHQ